MLILALFQISYVFLNSICKEDSGKEKKLRIDKTDPFLWWSSLLQKRVQNLVKHLIWIFLRKIINDYKGELKTLSNIWYGAFPQVVTGYRGEFIILPNIYDGASVSIGYD